MNTIGFSNYIQYEKNKQLFVFFYNLDTYCYREPNRKKETAFVNSEINRESHAIQS